MKTRFARAGNIQMFFILVMLIFMIKSKKAYIENVKIRFAWAVNMQKFFILVMSIFMIKYKKEYMENVKNKICLEW